MLCAVSSGEGSFVCLSGRVRLSLFCVCDGLRSFVTEWLPFVVARAEWGFYRLWLSPFMAPPRFAPDVSGFPLREPPAVVPTVLRLALDICWCCVLFRSATGDSGFLRLGRARAFATSTVECRFSGRWLVVVCCFALGPGVPGSRLVTNCFALGTDVLPGSILEVCCFALGT